MSSSINKWFNKILGKEIIFNKEFFIKSCIFLMSTTYMTTWTALAGLIPYYEGRYGAQFYVNITSAFYFPGLPIAILDTLFGERLDVFFSSRYSYIIRGLLCYAITLAIIISFIFYDSEQYVLLSFIMIGVTTWTLHSSATTIVAMFPSSYFLYLQVGFRIPEIYALVMVESLTLTEHPSIHNLNIFFAVTAVLLAIGIIAWIHVVTSKMAIHNFEMKDIKALHCVHEEEQESLISPDSNASTNKSYTDVKTKSVVAQEYEENGYSKHENKYKNIISTSYSQPTSSAYYAIFMIVYPYCIAMLLTLLSSILSASFFGYLSSPKNRNISQIMYFTRLFCDLLGRPLTLLPRPKFIMVFPDTIICISYVTCFVLI
jgi:hypothetical protein